MCPAANCQGGWVLDDLDEMTEAERAANLEWFEDDDDDARIEESIPCGQPCHSWEPKGRPGRRIYTWRWRDRHGNTGWMVAGRCPVCHTLLTIDGVEAGTLEDESEADAAV